MPSRVTSPAQIANDQLSRLLALETERPRFEEVLRRPRNSGGVNTREAQRTLQRLTDTLRRGRVPNVQRGAQRNVSGAIVGNRCKCSAKHCEIEAPFLDSLKPWSDIDRFLCFH